MYAFVAAGNLTVMPLVALEQSSPPTLPIASSVSSLVHPHRPSDCMPWVPEWQGRAPCGEWCPPICAAIDEWPGGGCDGWTVPGCHCRCAP